MQKTRLCQLLATAKIEKLKAIHNLLIVGAIAMKLLATAKIEKLKAIHNNFDEHKKTSLLLATAKIEKLKAIHNLHHKWINKRTVVSDC